MSAPGLAGAKAGHRGDPPPGDYVVEDWDNLTFTVSRAALRSPEVFAREQRAIFDRMWLYVGHDSEVASPGDFVTRTVAGRPLIFCRADDGEVQVYLNACPHKGTVLCRDTDGNARFFRCFYHAWTFSNTGELVSMPDEGAYPADPSFRRRYDLRTPPRVASRRGFVFVSFAPDGVDLDTHLGEAGEYVDLVADHSERGLEVVPGTHLYGVRGNWKLAVENALDGYHFGPTHSTFVKYLRDTGYETSDEGGLALSLGNGHAALVQSGHSGRAGFDWEPRMGPAERDRVAENRRALAERLGAERAARIADTSRILYVFPNLLLFDIEGLSIRHLEPVSPGYTRVSAWELAPRGEPADAREIRLNLLLSFLGPGGLATPDDIEAYECVQRGVEATRDDPRPNVDWSDISRGMELEASGEAGRSVDESALRSFWREWSRHLQATGDGSA